jgi:hypothetical protein
MSPPGHFGPLLPLDVQQAKGRSATIAAVSGAGSAVPRPPATVSVKVNAPAIPEPARADETGDARDRTTSVPPAQCQA